jgi:glycosyltransferase involved in cell wall biosynthesis
LEETLSIIVPCYNEEGSIGTVLHKIAETQLDGRLKKEIIIVDDGSTDNTTNVIQEFIRINSECKLHVIKHQQNRGKGACIRSALPFVNGKFLVIQDADFEYQPSEYNKLLKPMIDGHADVVYGSRFRGSEAHRVLFFMHTIGNKFLTFCSNVFTGLNLTDMETGYKTFRTETIRNVRLTEDRFGFEPEVTAKISRLKNIRIYEVGISYYGRSYEEGKKIKWHDGVKTLFCIIKYNSFSKR